MQIPSGWEAIKKLGSGPAAPLGWSGRSLEELADEVKRLYDVRLVYDYRQINSITVRDLTRMDDILAFRMFSRGKKFSRWWI